MREKAIRDRLREKRRAERAAMSKRKAVHCGSEWMQRQVRREWRQKPMIGADSVLPRGEKTATLS